jgi:teichoic acid transport system permease protein
LSLADWAAKNGLKRIGARPPFWRYLKEVWQRRGFAWTLSVYTLESVNARTRLGSWWNLLLPTIQAGTYGLIFGLILGANRPENFLPFLFTGVFLFAFMSGSFQNGAAAITGNSGLVKSLTFPRALLPLSSVIQQVINFWPQLLLLLIALLITGNPVTLNWLLLPVVVMLMTLFCFGLALFAARLNAQARDLGKLIPFVVRIAFYVSGVFFAVDKVLGQWPLVFVVFKFNPFYDYIQLARGLLVQGYEPTVELWLMCIGWAVVMPIFGLIFFWQAEEVYGRDD